MRIPKGMRKLLWSDEDKRTILAMCGHYTVAEMAKRIGCSEDRLRTCVRSMGASVKMTNKNIEVTTYDK